MISFCMNNLVMFKTKLIHANGYMRYYGSLILKTVHITTGLLKRCRFIHYSANSSVLKQRQFRKSAKVPFEDWINFLLTNNETREFIELIDDLIQHI